ncbi:hypothetical protein QYM36_014578 [Artemia franciscana]|uniref:Vesicle-fusing ATPase n=1 Tax=Artemia franciscana TaxID=6661 RepID=A0AA88HNU5_ARTSF|nr:hypothetical protein QYM36_014578 [Artemia franciscana]
MEADQVDELQEKLGIKVQIEIDFPDEAGRVKILNEYTEVMKNNHILDPDVNIGELASLTKNFSVVELAALVQAAFSWTLFRSVKMSTKEEDEFETIPDIDNVSLTRDDFFDALLEPEEVEVEFEIDHDGVNTISLTMDDFKNALDHDVKPALGYDYHLINQYQNGGIIKWCEEIPTIIKTGENLIKQVKNGSHGSLVIVVLEGKPQAGKTALAAYIAKSSNFSYIKVCASENMGILIQDDRRRAIKKCFDDAYRSQFSCILIDEIEELLGYSPIGPKYDEDILSDLNILLRKKPPKGRKLLVICTRSIWSDSDKSGIKHLFTNCQSPKNVKESQFPKVSIVKVPNIEKVDQIVYVLKRSEMFSLEDCNQIREEIGERRFSVGIKRLLFLLDLSSVKRQPKRLIEILENQGILKDVDEE